MSRRNFAAGCLGFAGLGSLPLWSQGVASRGVKPQPRGKPSGLPFNAHFVDIANEAGLVHPVIYGGADRKDYILETVGCGCAFIDYDNDGWMDLFVLNGTRITQAPAGLSNRLYKNNRDGTFTDVTADCGFVPDKTRWYSGCSLTDYDLDGHLDLFLASYLHFDFKSVPKPGESSNCNWKGIPVNCGPRGLPPGTLSLYRNKGNGQFDEVSAAAGIKKTD